MNLKKLDGGWRKETFLDEEKKIVISFVEKNKIKKEDFLKSIDLEVRAGEKGIPTRKFIDKGEEKNRYWVKWKYIEGEVKWKLNKEESLEVGKILRKLHLIKINHLDLKPGNIIWRENKIKGVIDFEESTIDNRQSTIDLANTLSWILISGGNQEYFLKGYKNKINRIKLQDELIKCLHMREQEGSKEAWLLLAKQRLELYQKEVKEKIYKIADLADLREKFKNKRIVFTVGAFDLLHWGHFDYLKKAKKEGDILIVGVSSDGSRKRLKGEGFPLVGDKTRLETLCFFGDIVDGVVIVEEDNVLSVLEKLKPDVFYTVLADWNEGIRKEEEENIVKKYKGKVVKADRFALKVSSSEVMKQVALSKVKQVLFGEIRRQPILKIKKKNFISKEIKVNDLEDLGEKLRKQNKTITFVSLSADLFHLGHARFIQKAKSTSDVLVVGLPNNASLKALKGAGRPIVDETSRALVLSELKYVDYVAIFDERTVLGSLKKLKPNVFFTIKEDWNSGFATSPEAQFMQSIGGKVVRTELQAPFISASKIINKAAGNLIKRKASDLLKLAETEEILNADFDPFSPEAQLTAREKGFYEKVWKQATAEKCVFCDLKEKYIIKEQDGVVLTTALFSYIDGHLLIIPKRHIESVNELNEKEERAILELSRFGTKLLKEKMGVENCWILVREGDGIKAGKTVLHLHFHVLPYDPRVIKMGETKLTMTPLDLANKLKNGQ